MAPFSPGAMADGVVYVSGTLASTRTTTSSMSATPRPRPRQVLETIKSVIETAGGTMDDVTFNHDLPHGLGRLRRRQQASMRSISRATSRRGYCIQCGLVKPDFLVEIATIAHVGKRDDFFSSERSEGSMPVASGDEVLASSDEWIDVLESARPGAETVLLSAGLGGAAGYWTPQLAALRQRYRVVTYDQAGTGRNRRELPADHSIAAMADEVLAVLDASGTPACHFVGHALGGLVGMDLAVRRPERLRSLTVVNGWAKAHAHTGAASRCALPC